VWDHRKLNGFSVINKLEQTISERNYIMTTIKRNYFTLAAVLIFAAYVGLSLQTSCIAMPISKHVVTVTEKDNDSTVTIAKGDTLVIRLEAQLGTGYGWQVVKNDTARLKSLGEPLVEPGQGLAGGVEHQVFRFGVLKSGSGTVELHYMRPWEKDVPPTKTYRITVQVN
jgi:inhibitor of cysteine peptidase